MNVRPIAGPAALIGYAVSIYGANAATEKWGMVTALGVTAAAGTVFAGFALLLRNVIQDRYGRLRVFLAILAGAALSFWSSPALAVASAAAFTLSELADMGVYTPLRARGWARAVLAASFVGAVADTLLFLWLAGFPIVDGMVGQVIGKYAAVTVPVVVLAAVRARRKSR